MKKSIYLISILLAVAAISFTSCNESGGDDRPFGSDLGTLEYFTVSSNPYVKFDRYGLCYLVSGLPQGDWHEGDRIIANFYISEKMAEGSPYAYKIEIYSVGRMVVQNIMEVTTPAQDTLGTDPFYESYDNKNEIWVSGGFLNLVAYMLYSESSTGHKISLASYKPSEMENGADTINLVLKHKSKNNTKKYSTQTYTSFNINRVLYTATMKGKTSVTFAVKVPVMIDPYSAIADTVIRYATYKLNTTPTEQAQIIMPPIKNIPLN